MAFSDYGIIAKKNNVYYTEYDMRKLYDIARYEGHGATGTFDFYVEVYKTRLIVKYKGEKIYDNTDYLNNVTEVGKREYYKIPKDIGGGYLEYYWYDKNRILCEYIHPITKDRYKMLFGYGVGERVYKWWKNFLKLSDKEIEKKCIMDLV